MARYGPTTLGGAALKQAFNRIVGGSTPSSSNSRYWNGEYVWVTPSDVSKNSQIYDSQRRITQEGLDSCVHGDIAQRVVSLLLRELLLET